MARNYGCYPPPVYYPQPVYQPSYYNPPAAAQPKLINGYECYNPGPNLGLLKSGMRTFGDNGSVILEPRADGKINILKRGANGCFEFYDVGSLYDDGYVAIKRETAPPENVPSEAPAAVDERFDPGQNIGLLKSGMRTFGDNGNVILEPRADGKINILKRGASGCFQLYGVGMLYDDGYVRIPKNTADNGDAAQNAKLAEDYQGSLRPPDRAAKDKKSESNQTPENKRTPEEPPKEHPPLMDDRLREISELLEKNKEVFYNPGNLRSYSQSQDQNGTVFTCKHKTFKDRKTEVRIINGVKEITVCNANGSAAGQTECVFKVGADGKPSEGIFTVTGSDGTKRSYKVEVARDASDPDFYRFTDPYKTEKLKGIEDFADHVSEVKVKVSDQANRYIGYTDAYPRTEGGVNANGIDAIEPVLRYERIPEASPPASPKSKPPEAPPMPKKESNAPPHREPEADPG